MNQHPIARMDTILRQGESPVKIYSSRQVSAWIYSVKCQNDEKYYTSIEKTRTSNWKGLTMSIYRESHAELECSSDYIDLPY